MSAAGRALMFMAMVAEVQAERNRLEAEDARLARWIPERMDGRLLWLQADGHRRPSCPK